MMASFSAQRRSCPACISSLLVCAWLILALAGCVSPSSLSSSPPVFPFARTAPGRPVLPDTRATRQSSAGSVDQAGRAATRKVGTTPQEAGKLEEEFYAPARRGGAGGSESRDSVAATATTSTSTSSEIVVDRESGREKTEYGDGEVEVIEEDWDRWSLFEAELGLDEYGFKINMTSSQRETARRFLGLASLFRKKKRIVGHVRRFVRKAFGYGAFTIGGLLGPRATVTNFGDSGPGTLRSLCGRRGPLYIRFAGSGVIRLKSRLECSSHKTIDGAGSSVKITGWGISINGQHDVIVKNLCIAGVKQDGITIRSSSNVWIDRCSITKVGDGGTDVIYGSHGVTISHCHYFNIWKTLLLGNGNNNNVDKMMTVTLAFNWFQSCISRMPRVRFGKVHVCSNVYDKWVRYAVGGSAGAKVLVEKNFFNAGRDPWVNNLHEGEHDGTKIMYRNNFMGAARLLRQAVGVVMVPYFCPRQSMQAIRSNAGCGFQCSA
ncbi:hypothetical protein CBR_g41373 [Chara braunii]|uniref:Pectate lyase n=1 Tax=Chara braunii TaxID=69332 RepID=A0A388LVN1_CHABU|nr:hypothetical protein CBR_g41373 [Chara braunii]|eukprot:GBG86378.1 hypothetical protein CBR_g41373 [Chara braunii]